MKSSTELPFIPKDFPKGLKTAIRRILRDCQNGGDLQRLRSRAVKAARKAWEATSSKDHPWDGDWRQHQTDGMTWDTNSDELVRDFFKVCEEVNRSLRDAARAKEIRHLTGEIRAQARRRETYGYQK